MRLQQFKLNKLAGNSLANREIKELKGGGSWGCSCSCAYVKLGPNGHSVDGCNYYMKKLLIIGFIIFAHCFPGVSQSIGGGRYFDPTKNTQIDLANYRFTYSLKYMPDSSKRQQVDEQRLILLIGDKISKSYNAEYEKSKSDISAPAGSAVGMNMQVLGGTEVFKDKANNKMNVKVMGMTGKFEYTEDYPVQNWEIGTEKKIIQGYSCQKATTRYLGRNYTAWFTHQIPIPNGPWKFGGLPGLILQVSDTREHYVFECIGIQELTKKEPIVVYNFKYEKTTRQKLNKMFKNEHINPVAMIESMGGIVVAVKGGTRSSSFPYNPIELE